MSFQNQGQTSSCIQCGSKFTNKSNLQTHIKSVHEGQKFECTQCKYKATKKTLLQKHLKSVHVNVKSEVKLKTEYLSDNEDIALEEYIEIDVKSEVEADVELV